MTELLYLQDFDITKANATVVSAENSEEGMDIVLDKTVFYPKGGGQDYDTGHIAQGERKVPVARVSLDENGFVHHYVAEVNILKFGDGVELFVDPERRACNTRLHSAGHVIDMAVEALGYDWIPGRGAHYPDMSFVEYDATLDPGQYETIRAEIEREANELLNEGKENSIKFVSLSELKELCRHVPEYLPANKPLRVVIYGQDFAVPCGGTHVKKLDQIGQINITKVKHKKGKVKVSYCVESD